MIIFPQRQLSTNKQKIRRKFAFLPMVSLLLFKFFTKATFCCWICVSLFNSLLKLRQLLRTLIKITRKYYNNKVLRRNGLFHWKFRNETAFIHQKQICISRYFSEKNLVKRNFLRNVIFCETQFSMKHNFLYSAWSYFTVLKRVYALSSGPAELPTRAARTFSVLIKSTWLCSAKRAAQSIQLKWNHTALTNLARVE